MYGFKTLFKYPTIFSFVTATCFWQGDGGDGGGEEGYFLFLLAALLSRYPMTLLFPTSWSLQCKPHFKFTASSNVLSRPPCGDTPTHTWPQELCKVIIHNPFLVFLTLNPVQIVKPDKFCCLLRMRQGPFIQIYFHQLSFSDVFLHYINLVVLKFILAHLKLSLAVLELIHNLP